MVGHVVSPFDLCGTLLIDGGLLVLCSLPGPPVLKQGRQISYYGPWPGWGISRNTMFLSLLLFCVKDSVYCRKLYYLKDHVLLRNYM